MQRQKSILSFLLKPSPASQDSSVDGPIDSKGADQLLVKKERDGNVDVSRRPCVVTSGSESSDDIRGTDTPPEKVPRRVLTSVVRANKEGGSSLFSSIMHKFVKDDDRQKTDHRENDDERSQERCGSSNISIRSRISNGSEGLPKQETVTPRRENDAISRLNGSMDLGFAFNIVNGGHEPGTETPAISPRVPCLKRVQDSAAKFGEEDHSFLGSSKRLKMLHDPICVKNQAGENDIVSQFKWLEPAQIKDTDGRRPGDPLYDKRTLYIPPDAFKKMSASQKQYWSIKCQYMDVILFFKVGKFYELYELDAEIGHKELDWKMTVSGVGKCRQVGISESGIDDAVQKLVARGYKVGRIEQMETSDQLKARGGNAVIRRKLVQVLTPATTNEGNIGPDAVHLLAIKEENNGLGSPVYGFAFVDCAALKFWVGSIGDDTSCAALGALLMQVSPKEVIYESRGLSRETEKALRKYSSAGSRPVQLTPAIAITDFVGVCEVRNMIELKGYFKGSSNSWSSSLDCINYQDVALCALGGLTAHLSRLMQDDLLRNGDLFPYQVYQGCLRMDGQTMANLEIFSNNVDGGPSGTLYRYLDSCVTQSGKRLLRRWICHPLKDVDTINNRLNVVEAFMANAEIVQLVAHYLRKLPDLERFLGRVKASIQSPASILPGLLGKKVLKQRVKAFGTLVKGLRIGMDLFKLLENESYLISLLRKVVKIPVLSGKDGLDQFLNQFEAAIESDFPSYKNHDVTDENAETLTILVELFIERATQWSDVINCMSCIDVLRCFAVIPSSVSGNMVRPVILPESKAITTSQKNSGPILKVKGLWHPYALGENGHLPVPNDVALGDGEDGHNPRSMLLTGPNMGGKSTLLRAACLAVILAQLGCYVPCEMCVLSVVDIIFTRLGATDRIMTGESTFFVECSETASILQNATQDSLVLLDELGRGTSTFDGYAIAYAVFRHLVEKVNCRLLFATHYHPLTKEFKSHPRVMLRHMACALKSKSTNSARDDKELVFLYHLAAGASPESYGLQVALMAGIPDHVVEIASSAGQAMKRLTRESFRLSEQRSAFSTVHEEWLRTLVSMSKLDGADLKEDAYDMLLCLWHELKCFYRTHRSG